MSIAVVKYNAGNVRSVVNALRRLGVEPLLTDDADELQHADKVLFPGQGEASTAMDYLREHHLDEVIKGLTQPVLGICIGQQLLCKHSDEGDTNCLGIFDVDVLRFHPKRHADKVPAMGWQEVRVTNDSKSIIPDCDYFYFVHSYYVPLCKWTIGEADYIVPYSAALHKDNFWTTQFHPEKSGKAGEQILKNFLAL